MIRTIFIVLTLLFTLSLMPNAAVVKAADVKATAQTQAVSSSSEVEEFDTTQGIQTSWQDLHPYEMARKVVKFYENPWGLCDDKTTRDRIFSKGLKHYSWFNKWLSYVFLMLQYRELYYQLARLVPVFNKEPERGDRHNDYEMKLRVAIWESTDLTPRDKTILSNITMSTVNTIGAMEVSDLRVFSCACSKAIGTYRRLKTELVELTQIPGPIMNMILHYGQAFTWGISAQQILEDPQAKSIPAFRYIVRPPDFGRLTVGPLMLSSIEGLLLHPGTRALGVANNFLDRLVLDFPDHVTTIGARHNLIAEVAVPRICRCLDSLELTGNCLNALPDDLATKLPNLDFFPLDDEDVERLGAQASELKKLCELRMKFKHDQQRWGSRRCVR